MEPGTTQAAGGDFRLFVKNKPNIYQVSILLEYKLGVVASFDWEMPKS